MNQYNPACTTSSAGPPPSEASSSSARLQLHRRTRPAAASTSFEPLNAHDRLQRMHALRHFYENSTGNRLPAKPSSRGELDVLKERHQFVRDSRVDPSTLPWEDQLASKFYDSLFKEYAVVNLKHYKSGAVALRWRTEEEVLSGIGHLTCGSLRCRYHEPSPSIVAAAQQQQQADDAASTTTTEEEVDVPLADPDSETPLVEARLEELEMPFGYLEQGVKKSALVKVVLCRECAKKLRYGRQKAKEIRAEKEERDHLAGGGATASSTRDSGVTTGLDSTSALSPPPSSFSSSSSSQRPRHRNEGRPSPPPPPPPVKAKEDQQDDDDDGDDDDFRPELPPDLDNRQRQQRRRNDSSNGDGAERERSNTRERHRRRSASPPSRRR